MGALLTDGRFSGGSHGFVVGHVSPEAQVGGPIALVRDGDNILVDAEQRVINVTNVDDAEWARRRAEWKAPPLKVKSERSVSSLPSCSLPSSGASPTSSRTIELQWQIYI